MPNELATTPEDFEAMARAASEFVADYYRGLVERPLIVPASSASIRALLEEPLPREGAGFASLLNTVRDAISHFSRHNGHPRFFGYITSPGTPVTAIGGMIGDALNINLTSWRSSPAATELEHVTVNWLKQMLGYPADAAGLLVSGGSMANFAALAAARSAKAPGDIVRDGMAAAGARMCCYVSEEGHYSVTKAAGMLGIGEANVRQVRTNGRQQIDMADLERRVQQDVAVGHLPFCVVANAGTTATGAFDPIGDLADFARRYGLWFHVDAAYGGFASLAPSCRHLFDRIAEADSVALDPHKWLFQPVGCGCVLYKDAASARAAFSHDAEIVRVMGAGPAESFAFWDYGPELSRPFRALNLWLLIKYAGADKLAETIERNMACARYFAELVAASGDFEMLAPAGLSIFCFRYAPAGFGGDLDVLNERILVGVQRCGSSYLSNAMVNGKFALRGCVLNYRTTARDMEILLEDVRRVAVEVMGER